MTDELLTRMSDGVLTLTINRPDAANALTHDVQGAIIDALERANVDLAVRAIVLTGAGDRHFCTGADLRADRDAPAQPPGAPAKPVGLVGRSLESPHGAQRVATTILDCAKPVIAAVNGTAAGIGAHIAFACDFVLTCEGVRFIMLHVRRGLVPGGAGAYLLPRIVGPQRAKELLIFGDDLPADEAQRLGLVNRVFPRPEFADGVGAWAARLAEGPTVAIGLTKRLVNASLDIDRTTSLREETLAQEMNTRTDDATEGVAAFVERREAHFRGW